MSRIQQLLQKAEQEGTARHTRQSGDGHGVRVPSTPVLLTPDETLPVSVDVVDSTSQERQAKAAEAEAKRRAVNRVEPEVRPHPLLVSATAPHSPAAERYRSLRTRIAQIENGTLRRVMMMTSPGRGEGKSMTTVNLGVTMAQEFHRRVVVIDADLRRPAVHSLLGLPSSPGLSDVLLGAASLEDVMIAIPDYRLTVIPAGLPPEQPTELLGSTAMRRLLDLLRTQFDRILIDTAPVAPLADAGVLARLADAVMIVVRAGRTQVPAIEQALGEIDQAKVLGLILNDASGIEASSYGFDIGAYPEDTRKRLRKEARRAAAAERR